MRGNMALIRGAVVALGLIVGLGGGAASAESGRWLKRPSDGVWEWHAGNPRVFADLNADGWVDAADLGLMVGLLSEPAPRVAEVREGDAPADLRVRADVNVSGEIDEKDLTLLLDALAFGAPIRGGGCPPDDRPPPCGNGGGSDDGGGLDGPPGGSDGFGSGDYGNGPGGTGPGVIPPDGGGPDSPSCAFRLLPGCDGASSTQAIGFGSVNIRAVATADGSAVQAEFEPAEGATVQPSDCGAYAVSAEEPGTYFIRATRTVNGQSCTASINVEIRVFDLDIDSDNDNTIGNEGEDEIEETVGIKVLIVNRGDADSDGVPDYADGYGLHGGEGHSRFTPISHNLVAVESLEGAEISFYYDARRMLLRMRSRWMTSKHTSPSTCDPRRRFGYGERQQAASAQLKISLTAAYPSHSKTYRGGSPSRRCEDRRQRRRSRLDSRLKMGQLLPTPFGSSRSMQ